MTASDKVAIRDQLAKILSSTSFSNSRRLARFLKFVVETTLEGNGARIKEFVIAVEVFEKTEAYDPQADSTVRTEATKLRSRLLHYYETDGRQDPIVISIPKGAYVAAFDDRRNGDAIARRAAALSAIKVGAMFFAAAVTVAVTILWLSRPKAVAAPRLVPLTSYPELEQQPSLSPDGSQVAFCWKGHIYVKQVGSEAVLQVTKDRAADCWPAWSPDASQIAFVRGNDVFLVSPLGGRERRVAESAGRVAWTPDGSALLVLEKTSALAQSIFRVTLASGEKRRLTFPSDTSIGDLDMAVSPDGDIAVCRSLQTQGCELFIVPRDGVEARRLTYDQRDIQGLTWTPDARDIVFASNRQGSYRLWRVRARPAARPGAFEMPRAVEAAGDDARNPATSRTARLAYQRSSINLVIRRAEITGAEGTTDHRINPSTPLIVSTRLDSAPAWSPDGRRIAFVSNRSGDFELWICDADGTNLLRLTTFGGPAVVNPGWSPVDGQRLIFSALTGPGGSFEGYFINAKGGPPERIRAPARRSMAFPKFSHDGRWIYFIPGPQEGAVEALRVPAGGGDAEQITRHGAFLPDDSPDGTLLYYGKFGTNGLWSTGASGGEERQVLNSVDGANWTVTERGIYYFEFPAEPQAPKVVRFYSFESGRSNQVGKVEPTADNCSGISVSPDGRWLLYSDVVNTTSDLMLVDRFR